MVAGYIEAGFLPDGLDFVEEGDMEAIAVKTDFLGVNYYTREIVRDEEAPDNQPQTVFGAPAEEHTEMDWEVYPDGLYHLLNRLHFDYRAPKLYVTENGCSYSDGPDADGKYPRSAAAGLSARTLHRLAASHRERRAAGRLLCLVVHG